MSSQSVIPRPVPVSNTSNNPPAQPKGQKPKHKRRVKTRGTSKPTKALPNWRISVAKQFDILRAYAAASSKGNRPATIQEASDIVKMSPKTVVMANAFLSSIGLLKRADTGAYIPSAEVVDFLAAYEWDKKTAAYKLGPKLRETWFAEALLPRISFDAVDENVAVSVLGEAANAGPVYKRELRMLLEYLVVTGIVQRDGGQIKQALKQAIASDTSTPSRPDDQPPVEPLRSNRVSTGYSAQSSTAGGIAFNVDVQVDMAEFAGWHPERISAFFRGIALVLSAKSGIEKEASGS